MYKQVALLKRNANLSKPQFIEYYESHHAKIGEKYLKGRAVRSMRRYLFPIVDPVYGVEGDPEYDVLMEIRSGPTNLDSFRGLDKWNSAVYAAAASS